MLRAAVLFLCFIPFAAHAVCNRGYYLDGAECKKCTSGYFCPGDDTRVKCPANAQDWKAIFTDRGYNVVSVSVNGHAWAADGVSIVSYANCFLDLYVDTREGGFLAQTYFDENMWMYVTSGFPLLWYRVNPGYYLSPYRNTTFKVWYNGIKSCTNAPAYAHYTGAGTPDAPNGSIKNANDCSWECDDGYFQENNECRTVCDNGYAWHDGGCVPLCPVDARYIKTGTGRSFNLYSMPYSTPALRVKRTNVVCYGVLAPGADGHTINVKYNGQMFHMVN